MKVLNPADRYSNPGQVLQSTAVAMDWGSKVVGDWSRGFSVIVSLSILGSSIAGSFGTSRIAMVVARAGMCVKLLKVPQMLKQKLIV